MTAAPATSVAFDPARDPLKLRRRVTLIGLGVALGLMTVFALGAGALWIEPLHVVEILLKAVGINTGGDVEPFQAAALLSVRLPRIVLALMCGATLGIAGASLQALFRNPLADPTLVGVADGAACGAVAWIVLGGMGLAAGLGAWGLILVAFGGGLIATAGVMLVARGEGRIDIATLLLAGLAMKALASALLGYLIFLANDLQMRTLTFWLLGSLGGATWSAIVPAAIMMGIAVAVLAMLARPFDALALGEAEAGHLGVPVERVKRITVVAVALGVGAGTALTGVIGFVGLIAPHIVRLVGGPDHRFVLPGSALLGALLIVGADTIARTFVAPAELPIGVVTSAIGAPFFFWLLRSRTHATVRR
jgi:iron complex transport system permease protein